MRDVTTRGEVDQLDLVRRAQSGDTKALDTLVRLNYDRMFRLALKYSSKTELAKDAVQESCIQIMRHVASLKNPARFHSWMGRIVINCVRLQHRKNGRLLFLGSYPETNTMGDETGADELIIQREELDLVEGFLQRTRRGDYDLFARLYVGGESVKKVSEETGVTTSAIKTRVHRARHRLRQYISLKHGRSVKAPRLFEGTSLAS